MALIEVDVRKRPLVMFDFDGTLANTMESITGAVRKVLIARGHHELAKKDLRRLIGPPFPQAFTLELGMDPVEAEQVTAEYRVINDAMGPEAWPLFEGMRELLEDLQAAGKRCAVASSKRIEILCNGVRDNQIEHLFELCQGKHADHPSETKTLAIERVLTALGLTADDAVMVGDRRFDVEAAAAHGVPCIGVLYGGTCEESELIDAGACALAHSVEELRALLLP